jgi:type IV pilus assembly protein PilM
MSEKNKKVVGMSVSDFSVEIVWAKKENGLIEVLSNNRIFLPEGVVKNGRIINSKILSGLLKDLFENAKPLPVPRNEKIFFALPRHSFYTHVFDYFEKDNKKLREIIEKEAGKAIPIKKDEIAIVYKKIEIKEEKQKILLFALEQKIISEWSDFLKNNNLFIQRFEIETLSLFRALEFEDFRKPICLLDIGLETINISFFSESGFLYEQQSQYGGKYITEKLARGLKIDYLQAEKIKRNTSLIYEKGDNEIAREIINTIFIHIAEEVKNGIARFKENYPACTEVSKIFLLGGGSNQKGIVDFFEERFSPIEIEPAKNFFSQSGLPIEYLSAFGLAQIGLSERLQKSEAAFFPHSNRIFLKFNLKYFSLVLTLALAVYFLNFSDQKIFLNAPSPEHKVEFRQEESANDRFDDNSENAFIPSEQTSGSEAEKEKKLKPKIRINDIGSSLNVRQDAGTDFDIIGRVFSGQEFDLIQEKSGWYEIKFKENINGWVFSEYADRIE